MHLALEANGFFFIFHIFDDKIGEFIAQTTGYLYVERTHFYRHKHLVQWNRHLVRGRDQAAAPTNFCQVSIFMSVNYLVFYVVFNDQNNRNCVQFTWNSIHLQKRLIFRVKLNKKNSKNIGENETKRREWIMFVLIWARQMNKTTIITCTIWALVWI